MKWQPREGFEQREDVGQLREDQVEGDDREYLFTPQGRVREGVVSPVQREGGMP